MRERRFFCSSAAALLVCVLATVAMPLHAQAVDPNVADELMRKGACMMCHQWNTERIGPSFNEIAKRYQAAGPQARQNLMRRIRQGSVGNVTPVPMGPCDMSRVSDDELSIILDRILQGSP